MAPAKHESEALAGLLSPGPYVTQELFSMLTGYTVKAVERKREEGYWVEGREWKRAPDGRVLISIDGFRRWVERGGKR